MFFRGIQDPELLTWELYSDDIISEDDVGSLATVSISVALPLLVVHVHVGPWLLSLSLLSKFYEIHSTATKSA